MNMKYFERYDSFTNGLDISLIMSDPNAGVSDPSKNMKNPDDIGIETKRISDSIDDPDNTKNVMKRNRIIIPERRKRDKRNRRYFKNKLDN